MCVITDNSKVDLILPQELLETFLASDLANRPGPEFRRIIMSLGEILSGDFLQEYIKQGETILPLVHVYMCRL
jgi:ribonuclease P/MRP protein subunit RPP40